MGDFYAKGDGVEKDPAKAMQWYIRAAENGDTDVMIKIGDMYNCGNGVNKNQKK